MLGPMKLRIAVPLALCIVAACSTVTPSSPRWYRMIPPIVNDKPDTAAPLSRWLVNPAHPYDSEQLCQTDLVHRQGDIAHLAVLRVAVGIGSHLPSFRCA